MAHRKKVRHVHEPGHLHELTFSCYRRLPLLTNDAWRERLARCLDEANREAEIELVAFVFMPEHLHLLVHLTDPARSISRYLARVKQPFSKQIKDILIRHQSHLPRDLTVRERPGKTCFRFWQEGSGFDRNLFSPVAIQASLDYIHNNPVKRGLCQRAVDWKWSSARFYLGDLPSRQDASLPWVHGLPGDALS
ncbi:transposase [Tautonia sp. JC769]|uniref:REP-associated tyrosine transposase n=1 Tax=Tautonia sp. JC769 TaxID=3232135 RepID=UPI00345A0ACB